MLQPPLASKPCPIYSKQSHSKKRGKQTKKNGLPLAKKKKKLRPGGPAAGTGGRGQQPALAARASSQY